MLGHGPFLNKPMMTPAEAETARDAATRARALVEASPASFTPKERGVVNAFAVRHESLGDPPTLGPEREEAAIVAFHEAMCPLADSLGEDADVWMWCAEGLMLHLPVVVRTMNGEDLRQTETSQHFNVRVQFNELHGERLSHLTTYRRLPGATHAK